MDDELLNLNGLAIALKIPRPWLIAEANAERIPYLKVGRRRLFSLTAVRRALADRAGLTGTNLPEVDHG